MLDFLKNLKAPRIPSKPGDPKPHGSFWKPWLSDVESEDVAFMPDVEAAIRKSGAKFAYLLSLLSAGTIIMFVIWADIATLDETTKGEASVIPSSRVQVIQNLEGGIVAQIMVREGQTVDKDQVLIKIENVAAQSGLKEKESRYYYLKAMIERLNAEIQNKPLKFSEDLEKNAPDAVANEIAQYELRKQQGNAQISVLQSQASQRSQEISEMRSRLSQLQNNLGVLQEEMNLTKPMVDQGLSPRVDLLRIQGQITDLQGEISTIRLSIPRAQSAAGEAQQKIAESKAAFRAQASQDLSTAKSEFESISEVVTAGKDTVKRTAVQSPLRGRVKDLKFNTVGGVIQPGEPIMEIVPLDESLLIEAKIKPSDIAFIRPDQQANVKITAYDSSVYGGLEGKVEQIGADTITDDQGNSFYRVKIRTNKSTLLHKGKELPIIPGMTAQVQILTGQKTVLDYLLKPILKARQNAMTER